MLTVNDAYSEKANMKPRNTGDLIVICYEINLITKPVVIIHDVRIRTNCDGGVGVVRRDKAGNFRGHAQVYRSTPIFSMW